MIFLEKDLEDMLWAAAQTRRGRDYLATQGLFISGLVFRQFPLGGYGITDLVCVDYVRCSEDSRHFNIDILELKKDDITVDALIQICRYKTGVIQLLKRHYGASVTANIRLHLIGSTVNSGEGFFFLCNEIKDLSLYEYRIEYDGLKLSQVNPTGDRWALVDNSRLVAPTFSFKDLRFMAKEYVQWKEVLEIANSFNG